MVAMDTTTTKPRSRVGLLAGLAEEQHGLLTAHNLHCAGVGSREISRWLDAGRLVTQAHGVYRVGGCPLTTEAAILAAVLVHGPDTWGSHFTAGWLWHVEGIGRPGRIDITRLADTSNERKAAKVHRTTHMPTHHQAHIGPIAVTSLPRTLFDLAGYLSPRALDRAIESALRTRSCTIAALYRVAEELGGRGRRGTVAMRAALEPRGRDYVPTESELDLLGRAVVAPIAGIDWQVELSDHQGYIRRVDGLHRAAGLVIEWDGAAFHDGYAQRQLDEMGDARLRAMGLEVVRYRWADVTQHPVVVRHEVSKLVAERTQTPELGTDHGRPCP